MRVYCFQKIFPHLLMNLRACLERIWYSFGILLCILFFYFKMTYNKMNSMFSLFLHSTLDFCQNFKNNDFLNGTRNCLTLWFTPSDIIVSFATKWVFLWAWQVLKMPISGQKDIKCPSWAEIKVLRRKPVECQIL